MKNVPHFWMMAMAATLLMFSCGSKPEAAGDAAATTEAAIAAAAEAAPPAKPVFAAGARPAKGSKVYIAPAGKANKVGAHLSNAINTEGYWSISGNQEEADFILQPVIQEKGMAVNGYVLLKIRMVPPLCSRPILKAISFAGNGFSAIGGLVCRWGKWLKSN
ncbi:MAG: hypothetical protein IPH78_15135 [Bacteroidetes bacterium]|nr:hypothetical protein [Bacteroidota bacterium]